MKNKKLIENLRKEIIEVSGKWDDNSLIDFKRLEELETKLSSIILANNNCLEDFSEKVKEIYFGMSDTEVKHEIDKIKKEMKLKQDGDR